MKQRHKNFKRKSSVLSARMIEISIRAPENGISTKKEAVVNFFPCYSKEVYKKKAANKIESPVKDKSEEAMVPFSPNEEHNISDNELKYTPQNEERRCWDFGVQNDELEKKVLELEKIVLTVREYANRQDEFKRKMKEKKLKIKSNVACMKIQRAYKVFRLKKKLTILKKLHDLQLRTRKTMLLSLLLKWRRINNSAKIIQRFYKLYKGRSKHKREPKKVKLLRHIMKINTSAEVYSDTNKQLAIRTIKKIYFQTYNSKLPSLNPNTQNKARGDMDELLSEESAHSENVEEFSQEEIIMTHINILNKEPHLTNSIKPLHSKSDKNLFRIFKKRESTNINDECSTNRDTYAPNSLANTNGNRNLVMWKTGRIEPKNIEDQELPSPEQSHPTIKYDDVKEDVEYIEDHKYSINYNVFI